ncbi:MAG: hypothetical protein NZ739_02165 [Verrucomicrobiae bacterium]|nr:hypothetical protein [Verrucomicrobiae bacterium]MDW7980813.1 hypothetical protein [Verrucomicrobiales bacterium]
MKPGEALDRGHITPLTYLQLRYLFRHHGAELIQVTGDRWKKKWLMPLLLPAVAIGWVWARLDYARDQNVDATEYRQALHHLFAPPLLFSRSLILVFRKI